MNTKRITFTCSILTLNEMILGAEGTDRKRLEAVFQRRVDRSLRHEYRWNKVRRWTTDRSMASLVAERAENLADRMRGLCADPAFSSGVACYRVTEQEAAMVAAALR